MPGLCRISCAGMQREVFCLLLAFALQVLPLYASSRTCILPSRPIVLAPGSAFSNVSLERDENGCEQAVFAIPLPHAGFALYFEASTDQHETDLDMSVFVAESSSAPLRETDDLVAPVTLSTRTYWMFSTHPGRERYVAGLYVFQLRCQTSGCGSINACYYVAPLIQPGSSFSATPTSPRTDAFAILADTGLYFTLSIRGGAAVSSLLHTSSRTVCANLEVDQGSYPLSLKPSSSGCFTPGLWLVLVRPLSAGTSMSVTNDASMNESLFSVFSMTTLLGLGVPVFLFVVLGLYCSVQRYRFSRGRVSRRSRVEIMEDVSADQRPVESALRRSPPPLHVVFHPDASEDPCIGHEVDVESREQCGQVSATEIANSREISRSRGENESNVGERGSGREEGRQGRRYPE
mmetsp:Transcript_27118/g.69874  ORF Transcript_27118/g.69874 Transcript_27118/m.69874 type:complete len:405 (-) Transcript_27118:264-1478(-)